MSNETPALRLRLGSQGCEDDEPEWGNWAHLLLGGFHAGQVIGARPQTIAALAAALDPATTEALFDQRDAAITERDRLRALVGDEEADREHWAAVPRDEAIRQANLFHEASRRWLHEHDKRRDERDEAQAEVERMRPVLEAARALAAHRRTDADPADATDALLAAVDVYNQPPSPDGSVTE